MTTTYASPALLDLQRALRPLPPGGGALGRWRWIVRRRLSGVRDMLLHDGVPPEASWLEPRYGAALRQRDSLLRRLSALGPQVLESPDIEPVRLEALRLLDDVRHHLQRRNDLAWDDVAEELGGSE